MVANRKRFFWIILFLACMCCIRGCGTKTEEKVEITVIHGWGSTEADHVAMREIYKEFEKEYPNINLNLIAMPSSTEVIHKVSDLLSVGEIPDVIFTGGDGRESIYKYMIKEGCAVDLMPFIRADSEFAENVSEVILENWTTKDGKLYTVSDVLLMGGYWYNREIFQKVGITNPPKTWEEWIEVCEKIRNSGENVTPIVLDVDHLSYLMTVLLADENTLEAMEGKELNSIENVEGFERILQKLRKVSQYAMLSEDYSYRDTLLKFNKGESAIYINGVWANSMIDSKHSVAYAAFPSEHGEGIGTLSACVGYILGDTGDDSRIEASVKFLKYMLSEPVAEKILMQTGQLPSNPKIEVSEENSNGKMVQAVESIKNAGILIETPENIWDLSEKVSFGENVVLYLKNKITEEELKKRLLGTRLSQE